jgi:hypothetical protein
MSGTRRQRAGLKYEIRKPDFRNTFGFLPIAIGIDTQILFRYFFFSTTLAWLNLYPASRKAT